MSIHFGLVGFDVTDVPHFEDNPRDEAEDSGDGEKNGGNYLECGHGWLGDGGSWETVVVRGRWWSGDGGGGRGRREDVRKTVAESSMPEAEGGVGQCEVMVRTHGLESRWAAHTTIHAQTN